MESQSKQEKRRSMASASAELIDLLENYDGYMKEVPPLKLLLIPHARVQHDCQAGPEIRRCMEQRDAEREKLQAEAAAKRAPIETQRDAELERVMEEARRKCQKIQKKFEPKLEGIKSQLQRDLDECYRRCYERVEGHAEPMKTLERDTSSDGMQNGWKRCRFYHQHSDGSEPGCRVWFRPAEANPDCDYEGCERQLSICAGCRFNVYETESCRICEACDCEEQHAEIPPELWKEPSMFCEDHFEAHEEECREVHQNLCGYNPCDGMMPAGYCRKTIADDDRAVCDECDKVICTGCIWRCDGVREDISWGGGGTRDCTARYCKECMPATLREKVSRGEEAYCGHCLGDGCDWEEEQERKRARRDAIRSLERGEYVHPSHYMDEDAYHERFG